jgi:hypothetical protein
MASRAGGPYADAMASGTFEEHAALVALLRAQPDGLSCRGRHDTWATGGHVQSAVLALREAGAARVSVLVVARWLKEDYGDNKSFIGELADRDYDPRTCPWTGAGCPHLAKASPVAFIALPA